MSWRCSPRTRIRPPWRKGCGSAFSRGSGSPPRSGSPRTCSRRSRSAAGCSTRATSCRISCSWACCCRCGAEPVAQTPGSTPTASRTALVAGASGLVGSRVLRLLLEEPAYARVTVLARRELPLSHKKLEQRVVSFDRLAQIADFPRVHDVFCCLGTTMKQAGSPDAFRKVDFTYVVELARVAVRHRASQFLVVTAVGADPQSRILYSRVKGEAEEAVRRLQFEGMQIFRPSLLVGARAQSRPAERVAGLLSMLVAWAFVGPLARYRPIKAEIVAGAMVRVAREAPRGTHVRSEEHTSELQSRLHLVCRLLLEKKKNMNSTLNLQNGVQEVNE